MCSTSYETDGGSRDRLWLKRESERMMIEEIKRMDDLAERVMQTETDYDEDGRDGHCSEC